MSALLAVVLALSLVANVFAATEVVRAAKECGFCFRRRVLWRVTPTGLTVAGASSRPSLSWPTIYDRPADAAR
ncbi:hypothetical protein [Mycobacterium palustre]|uniref:Uncharacterized protein n=1 Tax=Mycobacterium palustre TaxID=153971 RepID=A0A1X1ZPA6_9MYCO|nr:hypothetical protein [Mycobacterium palustre]ORW25167.1 hypothetical protein AWC19_08240 [Mycobacterium palustre]